MLSYRFIDRHAYQFLDVPEQFQKPYKYIQQISPVIKYGR